MFKSALSLLLRTSDVIKLMLLVRLLRITNYKRYFSSNRLRWLEIFLEDSITTAATRRRFIVARYDYTTPLRLVTGISLVASDVTIL